MGGCRMIEIILCEGKYRFVLEARGTLCESVYCERYGEAWQDFTGDHAVSALFNYAADLTLENERLKSSKEIALVTWVRKEFHKSACILGV